MSNHRTDKNGLIALVLTTGFLLAACGGGGGGGGGTPAAAAPVTPTSSSSSTTSVASSSSVASIASSSSSSSSSVTPSSSSSSSSTTSSTSSSSSSVTITWNSYSADVDTNVATAISYADGTQGAFAQITGSVVDSTGTANFVDYMTANGDGTVTLDSSAVPQNRSIVRTLKPAVDTSATYPKYITYLVRIAPVPGVTYDASTYLAEFEIPMSEPTQGGRIVATVRDDSFKGIRLGQFENGGPGINSSTLDMTVPHIYQVSITLTAANSATVTIYVDGNSTPVLGPLTTTNLQNSFFTGHNYIQFGDNRNLVFRGTLDWMAWTNSGAFTPATLNGRLPGGLGVTTGY